MSCLLLLIFNLSFCQCFPFFVTGHFNIYTREAGAGGLSIACEGPSKADIEFQDRKDGSCGVNYTCTEPGRCTEIILVVYPHCISRITWDSLYVFQTNCVSRRLVKKIKRMV